LSYLSLTERDREEMLAAIGVSSVEELFRDIPAGVRFDRDLALEPALAAHELDELLDDRKTDPGAAAGPIARLLDPVEALEDMLEIVSRYRLARVDD